MRRAIAGYAEAVAEGGVDAIYVATPPSEHAAHALLCIEAGIPVLVEKLFTSGAAEALRVADAARSNSVFAMEAMWTRFLPAAQAMRDQLAARSVGEVRLVAGNFGTSQAPDRANGIFNPALGGGALAHLGAYPLSLAQWLFGPPTLVQAMGTIGSTGVDEDVAFQLQYPGGVIGSFFVSIRAWAPDDFQVLGTEGMIGVRGSIVRPYGLEVTHEAPHRPEEGRSSAGTRASASTRSSTTSRSVQVDRAAAAAAVSTTAIPATVITTKRTRYAPASSAVPVKARSCRCATVSPWPLLQT